VLDRLLDERGDERAERRQEIDLRRVECKLSAALVAREETEAPSLADEGHDDERAEPERPREIVRQFLVARICHEDGATRVERATKGVEVRDGQNGRQRARLGRRQPVAGERHQRRRFGDKADDSDPLEPESVGDCGAGTLEHRTRTKLTACQRSSQRVQCLELDVRLGGHGNPGFCVVPQEFRVYSDDQEPRINARVPMTITGLRRRPEPAQGP
jgi:hypothetical protein